MLEASPLNWTIVGSPSIVEGDPTGNFTTSADYPPPGNKEVIGAGDLGLFMLKELENNRYLNKRVGISTT
jgi:putative NADH-flavin reductase